MSKVGSVERCSLLYGAAVFIVLAIVTFCLAVSYETNGPAPAAPAASGVKP